MRRDITEKEVATLYLENWPIKKITRHFNCKRDTVELRLKKARKLYPELNWNKRREIKVSETPNCEKNCTANATWVIGFTDGPEEHFFCGWHVVSGIRKTRTFNEETVTIRELK